MLDDVKEMARGRWPALLGGIMTERMLSGKPGPCPVCGTPKNKFRFDDKGGDGGWICTCSAGDGFALLQAVNSWDFAQAAKYVREQAGRFKAAPAQQGRSEESKSDALQRVWGGAVKVSPGDPVAQYLLRRCGVTDVPAALRYHPELPYRHDNGSTTYHPAMIARVVGPDGGPRTLHRTYLTSDGAKADLPTVRKLMTPKQDGAMANVAVRLARPADGWLGVAEGIETALCAAERFSVPVWSCISAGLLESFRPPEGVALLTIFADNDRSYTGQASAYKLARSVVMMGIECRVCLPEAEGTDWADGQEKA